MQGYVHDGPIINSAKRGSELTLSRMTAIVNQVSMEILEKDNCSAHRLGAKLQQVPREAQSGAHAPQSIRRRSSRDDFR